MQRPYVICHMLASIDGKIAGDFFSVPETLPAIRKYGELRNFYNCPATIYGTTTMAEGYADGLAPQLSAGSAVFQKEDYIAESDVKNYIVSVDPKGILGFGSKYIEKKNRPRAHVIEVLTEQVSNEYLAYLRGFDISYIFAGRERLDCALLLRKLKSLLGIENVLLAGGGIINGSFLQEGMIDELSLVLSPTADGSRVAATLFEKAEFLSEGRPAAFTLKAVEQIDNDTLWLRYLLKR